MDALRDISMSFRVTSERGWPVAGNWAIGSEGAAGEGCTVCGACISMGSREVSRPTESLGGLDLAGLLMVGEEELEALTVVSP